ncbi:glycosyltransferase [Acidothermaceae bacterium B102]|nr:glycosyltransferase [Acidothermaceae bacterium B102]
MTQTIAEATGAASADAVQPPARLAVAYLVSCYPKLSHTFIRREVEALRGQGFDVQTFSVRVPAAHEILSAADQREAESTRYLLGGKGALVAAQLRLLATAPRAYLATLRGALATGSPTLRSRLWQLFYFLEAAGLVVALRGTGIRRIHVHFANNAADVARTAAALGCALEPESPWSWTMSMHGPTEFGDASRFDLPAKTESAAFVACISDYCRSQLMSLVGPEHWSKLHVVHMGVDVAHAAPAEARDRAVSSPVRVLFVGRLVPEKGVPLFVSAIEQLVARGLAVDAVVVGDGPMRGQLEGGLAERGLAGAVRFVGAVGQDELPEWYAWADIFCLPSFAEGLPVVLMEALLQGLAVVTTPIAGIPELVVDGRTGVLVPPGRVTPLADAIALLAAEPERRGRLGAAGRAAVERDFDASKSAATLGQLFQGLHR